MPEPDLGPGWELTDAERDVLYADELALDNLHAPWGRATLERAVQRIVAGRLAGARAAYVAALQAWHEADPDHCGGECFRSALIDAALHRSPDAEPDHD